MWFNILLSKYLRSIIPKICKTQKIKPNKNNFRIRICNNMTFAVI